MDRQFNKGDIVQNFKRREVIDGSMQYIYQIVDVATHSETNERLVVYRALYPPYDTWVRPFEMFMSHVDKCKYPENTQEYRFELVPDSFYREQLYIDKAWYSFEDLLGIVKVLRSKDGCPWDQKQTFESMRKCLLEEAQEAVDAVDNHDMDNLCEELGDVLLQVVMNGQIAKDEELFSIESIIEGVSKKLVRRHPHVFGDEEVDDSPEKAKEKWQEMKRREKEV